MKSSLSSVNEFETETQTKQFVLFSLENDLYGVHVEQVIQVQEYKSVTHIPGAPIYVLGVLNLRGSIITVINLKKRLHISEDYPEEGTGHVLFTQLGEQTVGMLVDKVLTLRKIPTSIIKEELDLISSRIPMEYISGAASLEDEIVVLLNLQKILSDYEVEQIFREQEKIEHILKEKEKEKVAISQEKLVDLDLEKKTEKRLKQKRSKKKDT
ncbi:MAG: chemotaxis protein CheW [Promethearchaeota archaeon]